jgi:thiol-disulfide isomerase/thioredoxin
VTRRSLVLVLAAFLLAGGAVALAGFVLLDEREEPRTSTRTTTAEDLARAGEPAPKLAGRDPITGKRVQLGQFAGKRVVVSVWASWCDLCAEQAKAIRRFSRGHRKVVVLGIDLNDEAEDARDYYERWKWEHPSIADPRGVLAARLEVGVLPTTIFLTTDHRVVTRIEGPATFGELEQALEETRLAS